MRIGLLSWESLHSVAVGGVAAHVTELVAALERRGHEVHAFVRLGQGQPTYERVDGGLLHVLVPHALLLAAETETLRLRLQLLLTLSSWRSERSALRTALSAVASLPSAEFEDGGNGPGPGEAGWSMDLLAEEVRAGLTALRRRLLAQETVIADVSKGFGDDAVIPVTLRSLLGDIRAELDGLQELALEFVGPIDPASLDARLVERLRLELNRDGRLYL